MNTIIEHNVETGEIVKREMSAEELAQWESDKAAVVAETAAKAAARQAILDRLGITADEAQLLLGSN